MAHHKTEKSIFLHEKVMLCASNRFTPSNTRLLLDAESESEIRIKIGLKLTEIEGLEYVMRNMQRVRELSQKKRFGAYRTLTPGYPRILCDAIDESEIRIKIG